MLNKIGGRATERFAAFSILLLMLTVTLITTGCSHSVKQSINEHYTALAPRTVAVLPVQWGELANGQEVEVADAFRHMTAEKLRTLNYSTPTLKSIDRKIKSGNIDLTKPGLSATSLGTDSVLVIDILDWESNIFVTYAYLKVKALFSLYSNKGVKLWSAEYSTAESDIKLDKESMKLAIIDVYEPRVQRFVSDILSTLPAGNASVRKDSYFNWLP